MSRNFAFACLLSLLLLSGCSYFRLPILQGNIVDYDKAEKVELGMSPRQVEFLLGTPLIRDSFGSPRWDYVVYYRNPDAVVLQRNLSIYFENDAVSQIKGRDELLADWRKQKAAVKKATELLETPHPGQFPANNNSVPADPSNPVEPHPVLPPTDPAMREEQFSTQPESTATTPDSESNSSVPAAPAATAEQPADTKAQQTDNKSNNATEDENYPADMSTIYKQ